MGFKFLKFLRNDPVEPPWTGKPEPEESNIPIKSEPAEKPNPGGPANQITSLLSHPAEQTRKTTFWFAKPLLVICAMFVCAGLIVNYLFDKRPHLIFTSEIEEAKYYVDHEQFNIAEEICKRLLQSDSNSNSLDLHYIRIESHYLQKPSDDEDKLKITEIDSLKNEYLNIADSVFFVNNSRGDILVPRNDSIKSSIGYYGYGLCMAFEKNYDQALEAYLAVKNKDQKYLNNSIGVNYLERKKSRAIAESYFKKEIALRGNIEGAYNNLFKILAQEDRWKKVYALINDSTARSNCPPAIASAAYFSKGNLLEYITYIVDVQLAIINRLGFIGALLILVCWLFYLRRIDLFGSEKWCYIISTCLLGMAFSFLVFPVTDYATSSIGWGLSGAFMNDFLYFVIRVGIVEEVVKILPLLIMIRFTKVIKEPVDFIIYASVSALGFSFMENLLYFHSDSLGEIAGRAMTASFLHMFLSSIVAYSLIQSVYKSKKNSVLRFLYFLGLAAFIHGLYDFILSDGEGLVKLFAIVILALGVIQYAIFLTNALNLSPFFDEKKTFDIHKLKLSLCYSFALIFIFEYLAIGLNAGSRAANKEILSGMTLGGFLLPFLSSGLGGIALKKGEIKAGFETLRYGLFTRSLMDSLFAASHTALYTGGGAFIVYLIIQQPATGLFFAFKILWSLATGTKKKKESSNRVTELPPDNDSENSSEETEDQEWKDGRDTSLPKPVEIGKDGKIIRRKK